MMSLGIQRKSPHSQWLNIANDRILTDVTTKSVSIKWNALSCTALARDRRLHLNPLGELSAFAAQR
jgi:hypothetical protein